jgi:pimeloyl-ACP methyl ester carboxylesterase
MKFLVSIIIILIWNKGTAQNQPNSYSKKLYPCKLEGVGDSVLCGFYSVFENHKTNKGRKIDLYIIVLPALNKKFSQPPIFYFDGGPGIAATKNASWFAEENNPYRQNHDIVLIDIRGTGKSNPLHCLSLQNRNDLLDGFTEMYPPEMVKKCFDSLSKIADLTQYSTTNIARDIDEVRNWLGYNKIHLYGLSYGTRLAQEYMRRYPSAIETVTLQSPTSTGNKMPLYHAAYAQVTLEMLFNDCAKDSLCNKNFPELKKEFNTLMRDGKAQAFSTTHLMADGKIKNISIPWYSFQTKIRTQMYDPGALRKIPFIIHQTYKGNWKPFLDMYPQQKKVNDFLAEGLYLCITCSEDVPFIKKQESDNLTKNTFMGKYRIQQQQQACTNWVAGTIPSDFLTPVHSNLPVLIIAGGWDPVTPVSLAREIAVHLINSQLVIIPQMSHGFDGLSNGECFDYMVLEFIGSSGKLKVNSDCIKTMQPPSYKISEDTNNKNFNKK